MQIIASAGAGKTEVVSQRVVSLLGEGIDGRQIVAFTFNKKAAEKLKQRIALRTEQLLGADAVRHLTGLFVGTIHAYCFRLLQQMSPRYETYDVLDDAQLTALLSRESTRLGIKDLSQSRSKFDAIRIFRSNAATGSLTFEADTPVGPPTWSGSHSTTVTPSSGSVEWRLHTGRTSHSSVRWSTTLNQISARCGCETAA